MALREVRTPLQFETEQPAEPRAPQPQVNHAQVLAVLSAIAMVLGARLLLLIGLITAFTLMLTAVIYPSPASLWGAGLYASLVFIPLLIFSAFSRNGG